MLRSFDYSLCSFYFFYRKTSPDCSISTLKKTDFFLSKLTRIQYFLSNITINYFLSFAINLIYLDAMQIFSRVGQNRSTKIAAEGWEKTSEANKNEIEMLNKCISH